MPYISPLALKYPTQQQFKRSPLGGVTVTVLTDWHIIIYINDIVTSFKVATFVAYNTRIDTIIAIKFRTAIKVI